MYCKQVLHSYFNSDDVVFDLDKLKKIVTKAAPGYMYNYFCGVDARQDTNKREMIKRVSVVHLLASCVVRSRDAIPHLSQMIAIVNHAMHMTGRSVMFYSKLGLGLSSDAFTKIKKKFAYGEEGICGPLFRSIRQGDHVVMDNTQQSNTYDGGSIQ